MQEFDYIETPENVELQRSLAGIGSRFCAGLLDALILIALLSVMALMLILMSLLSLSSFDVVSEGGWMAIAFMILLLFAVYWGYFVFFELRTNGQSPGKKRLKIRVVKEGGGAITFGDVAIRNLLRAVDGLFFYAVAGVAMFVSNKAQRLGDLAAGTVVVSEQVADYRSRTDSRGKRQQEEEASAEGLRATGLQPDEYRALANYYSRRADLSLEARTRLLPRLLEPVLKRSNVQLPDMTLETLEQYLHVLLQAAREAQPPPAPQPKSEGDAQ